VCGVCVCVCVFENVCLYMQQGQCSPRLGSGREVHSSLREREREREKEGEGEREKREREREVQHRRGITFRLQRGGRDFRLVYCSLV
jgi:hypothetical protein